MPLSVFAALELRPGPDSSGVWLNGSTAVPQVERGAAARPERQRREARLGALAQRMLKEPRRRARLLRRWWFGRGERGWKVEVSADGVPHAVRRSEGEAERGEQARTARRERSSGRVEGDAASAPLYEKLSARRKWKARELLASADKGEGGAHHKGEGAAHLLVLEVTFQ